MSGLPPFSRPVDIAAIGVGGLVETVEAGAAERTALANALGLVEIGALTADLAFHREAKGKIHLDGRVRAEIVQNCVVSLEPVAQSIDEPFSVRFAQAPAGPPGPAKAGAEIRVDPAEDDPPELVTGPAIDAGQIVIEHFVLAIDPYPRTPGAALPDNPAEAPENRSDSPFAALSRIGQQDPVKR